MPLLQLAFASGEASLSVREFSVREGISSLFAVSVVAVSESPALDLEAIVGRPASLRANAGAAGGRAWTGVCRSIAQAQAEPSGLSTYELHLVPTLWLLTQRRGHRVFQHASIPDIVDTLLREWGVESSWRVDRAQHPRLEYRVQYGESDFDFMSRLLEEAGIAYVFDEDETRGSVLALDDAPHLAKPRAAPPLRFVDNPARAVDREFVTRVRLSHEVRPGAHRIRDYDFRNPSFALQAEATVEEAHEKRLEQYHHRPGSFLVETGRAGDTPVADGRGIARHDGVAGRAEAERALLADRVGKCAVTFETNTVDLRPGTVFSIDQHPHPELGETRLLLGVELAIDGTPEGTWSISGRALFADVVHRPARRTPKPKASGVETATVVGPPGQEIHPDEFGRVRVHFPWDREGKRDDGDSCWLRVSQGWAGTGFGMINLPRIGQEVLVGFLGSDPDQPIIVGRVFNAAEQVPYKLPEHKTRSTWKSSSSPGGEGFNELLFEDLAGKELVYEQAQRDRRRLVKRDETITVGNDRRKLVKANELETTLLDRTEVTNANRIEITGVNRTYVISGKRSTLVRSDDDERTGGSLRRSVDGDADLVFGADRRERIAGASHLAVQGDARARVGGAHSLTVGGDRHEKIGGRAAIDAGGAIHLKTASAMVLEVGEDFTIKGPGGFLRINSEGVTIHGSLVKVNSGGSPGSGAGASPIAPDEAKPAVVEEPGSPEPDDVSRTGLGQ